MVIIIRVAVVVVVVIVVAVVVAVIMAAVIAPGKGSGKNPENFSLRRKRRSPSGFLLQNGARMGLIGIPIDILPV